MDKKIVSFLLGVDPVVLGCSSGFGTSRLCRELELLNGRHFYVVRFEDDASFRMFVADAIGVPLKYVERLVWHGGWD